MCALDPPGGFTSGMPRVVYAAPGATGSGYTASDPRDIAAVQVGARPGSTVRLCTGDFEPLTFTVANVTVEAAAGHTPDLCATPSGASTAVPVAAMRAGVLSTEERKRNRRKLAHLVATGATLPAGTFEVDVSDGSVPVGTGQSVVGAGQASTILDVYPKRPPAALNLFVATGASGAVTMSDLTVHAFTDLAGDGSDTNLRNSHVFFRQSDGNVTVARVTVTGRPGAAIEFSGVGAFTITDCTLSGYVSPLARFESNDVASPGATTISGCTITGVDSGPTSIGIYIHPHIPITVTNTTWRDFNRYAIYQNGSPYADANALIEDCTFERCDVIQVGQHSTATLNRIVWRYWRDGPGSPIRGNIVVNDSTLNMGPWTTLFDQAHTVTFDGCSFGFTGGTPIVFNEGTVTLTFTNCTWTVTQGGMVLLWTEAVGGTITMAGTVNDTATSGDAVRVLGTVTLDRSALTVNTTRPATFWNLGPNVTVIPPSDTDPP